MHLYGFVKDPQLFEPPLLCIRKMDSQRLKERGSSPKTGTPAASSSSPLYRGLAPVPEKLRNSTCMQKQHQLLATGATIKRSVPMVSECVAGSATPAPRGHECRGGDYAGLLSPSVKGAMQRQANPGSRNNRNTQAVSSGGCCKPSVSWVPGSLFVVQQQLDAFVWNSVPVPSASCLHRGFNIIVPSLCWKFSRSQRSQRPAFWPEPH